MELIARGGQTQGPHEDNPLLFLHSLFSTQLKAQTFLCSAAHVENTVNARTSGCINQLLDPWPFIFISLPKIKNLS